MFCPVCEAEFVEGVGRCPDDLVDLVERLPPAGHRHRRHVSDADRPAVVVRRLPGQPELGEPMAEFIRAALEENHIDVWTTGEFWTPGPYGRALGNPVVEVLVSPEDAERALKIIAEVEGSQPAADTPGEDEDDDAAE